MTAAFGSNSEAARFTLIAASDTEAAKFIAASGFNNSTSLGEWRAYESGINAPYPADSSFLHVCSQIG